MTRLFKYPRTLHIESSRLQSGDEDLEAIPFSDLEGRHLVVEEKMDGMNSGINFDDTPNLLLQSRGHYLTGGWRERHFSLLKMWATAKQNELFDILEDRYIMYGEWMFAKHTEYYDMLPHFFLEFDIMDKETGEFLSTERRRKLLAGTCVVSVPVLHEGVISSLDDLKNLVRTSHFKSQQWKDALEAAVGERALPLETALKQTDDSDLSEGLYIKVEEEGRVVGRYKYVRHGFLQAVLESDSHWQSRPVIPNRLRAGVDLFRNQVESLNEEED